MKKLILLLMLFSYTCGYTQSIIKENKVELSMSSTSNKKNTVVTFTKGDTIYSFLYYKGILVGSDKIHKSLGKRKTDMNIVNGAISRLQSSHVVNEYRR